MKIEERADRAAATMDRWTIAVAAAVLMLTIGTIYSWGVFTQPLLAAFQWDLTVTTGTYAIANFCLAAIGAVIGGFWQDRAGPRRVAMVGVTLWGCGKRCDESLVLAACCRCNLTSGLDRGCVKTLGTFAN